MYQGQGQVWSDIVDPAVTGNLWDVAAVGERLTVVSAQSPTGLFQRVGSGSWQPVPLGAVKRPTTHRLCVGANQLWSVGEYDLFKFDGSKWDRVSCPENEP